MGTQKASLPAWKTFSMALLAGAYVGFGGFLAMSIGANCPELAASNPGLQKIIFGAFGLPLGLTMVVVCGKWCLPLCIGLFWGSPLAMVGGKCCLFLLWSNPCGSTWWICLWGPMLVSCVQQALGLTMAVCLW